MAGSEDELAAGAGDRSSLRASDADREQVITVLKSAFTQGRLTRDEFYLRATQVFASRTYADLDALTADIPAGLAKPQPPEPARQPDSKRLIRRGTAVGAGAGMVIPAVTIMLAGGPPVFAVFFGVLISASIAVLLPGFLTLLSWVFDRDFSGQPSQGPPPSARGQGYQRLASADPTGSSCQIDQEPPHTVEVGRRRLPRPQLPSLLAPHRWCRPTPLNSVLARQLGAARARCHTEGAA
jgi:hypothetical protein